MRTTPSRVFKARPTGLYSSIGTALHAAIGLERLRCTKALLKSNTVDVNAKDASGDAPLHLVAKNDNPLDYLQVLLLRTEVNINVKNRAGETPLHLMCNRKNMSSSAELLLMREDVDINATNTSGATVLHQLLCRASFDVSSENVGLILARHELNVYLQDMNVHTVLTSWIVHSYERRQQNRRPACNLNIIPRLLGNGFPDTRITIRSVSIYKLPLLYALVLSFGEAAVVDHVHDVIRQSIDCLTEIDDNGNTVLHLIESPAVIKEVLQWPEAPVDVRNHAGNLPLHLLMKRSSPEIASWFRHSVAHHAEVIRAYIQIGRADLNAWDADGSTLLHLVRDESSLVELLKGAGYNSRAKNDLGMTPLRYKLNELEYWPAARWYLGPIITLLMENERVDSGSIDVQGNTMLHVWAKHWSHYDFWKFEAKLFDVPTVFVRGRKIDANAKDKSGHTALALLDLITVNEVSYQRHLKLRRRELLQPRHVRVA